MALITCQECGKEFSDKADKCPNCGCPLPFVSQQMYDPQQQSFEQQSPSNQYTFIPTATPQPVKKSSKLAITGFIFSLIFCLPIFPIAGLIMCFIALKDKSYKTGLAKAGIIISIISIVLGFAFWNSDSTTSSNKEETAASSSAQETIISSAEAVESVTPETESFSVETVEEIVAPTESREDFIASCVEPDYKTLARYPEENIGMRIKLKVKIQQIVQGGWFDDGVYYRVYTDTSGYDLYFDDEYFMFDKRIDDTTKLLADDIIEVYGVFSGTQAITRALTGTDEDVPSFEAYYINIIE